MLSRLVSCLLAGVLFVVLQPQSVTAQECGACWEAVDRRTNQLYHCFAEMVEDCGEGESSNEEELEDFIHMGQFTCEAETEDPGGCHAEWKSGDCYGEHFECLTLATAASKDLGFFGSGITVDRMKFLVNTCSPPTTEEEFTDVFLAR